MDLLAQRYANPFFVLDEFIKINQLHDFVFEFLKTIYEEKIEEQKEKAEKQKWDYFLHRIFDKSYNDFCESIKIETKEKPSDEELKNIVDESSEIINMEFDMEGGDN